jgi:type II secretory pathway predicted ATPase ExeA
LYLGYWGLALKPFENTPDSNFFYASSMHAAALDRVLYAVTEQKGCVLLTGDYGCGKTALVRRAIDSLSKDLYDVAMLNFPLFTSDEFMREVLFQFGVDDPIEGSHLSLFHRVGGMLYERFSQGRKNLLVIDEAQLISDPDVYEQLRLTLNLQFEDRFLVDIMLVGQPELRDTIGQFPHMDSRIGVRCHLEGFDRDDTIAYIRHRLRIAGADRELFTPGALQVIHELTRGTPRRINSICDMCLFDGANLAVRVVDESIARKAS